MLRSISSAHAKSCITLLLWARILGVAIARKVVVEDLETDKIVYSKGWPEYRNCLRCTPAPDPAPVHGIWHKRGGFYGDLDFSFKFNGTGVEVRLIEICPNSSSTPVRCFIDGIERGAVAKVQNCSKPGYFYNQTICSVQGLSNEEHTLNGVSAAPFLFDYLIYEIEDSNGTANSPSEDVTANPYIATNLFTSFNPTSSNLEVTQESGTSSLSNTNLARIVGGIVSGITVLAFAILGVLWYRSKKRSKKGERRWPSPLSNEIHPEPTLPIPKTLSAVTYDSLGYTEKNAYFGIQSLSANSSAGTKGPVPP